MSDKIKEILDAPEVPDELKPEKIPELIKTRGTGKKNIKLTVFRSAAAAAACLIAAAGISQMTGRIGNFNTENTAAVLNGTHNFSDEKKDVSKDADAEATAEENAESADSADAGDSDFVKTGSYEELHEHLTESLRRGEKYFFEYGGIVGEEESDIINAVAAPSADTGIYDKGDSEDVYDTLSQVEGIAEADIIKASSNAVYYLTDNCLRYVPFDSKTGKFRDSSRIGLMEAAGYGEEEYGSDIVEMYLDGDRLAVIAHVYGGEKSVSLSGVFVFDVSSDSPEFVSSSFQSGYYRSSRMKDGIMYLITTQSVDYRFADDESEYEKYIPCAGESVYDMNCLPCESIYVPREWDDDISFGYTNISAVDIRNSAEALNSVSVAGWSGDIYCSAENLYTVSGVNRSGDTYTRITRFTLENNALEPVASGEVNGLIKDQFSMDEYNGFFRIATTSYDESYEQVNNVYVLDMNMNTAGSVTGFAETESVKSVSFNGDTGYVVTYERTDPLFAVDLSDPYNPVITDEFKITGYSSFLRKWDDDRLFGFGIDATEDAYEVGVKLVMFDVSDGGELKECGYYTISGELAHGIESCAVYDRKALLYSPERNLIGFPLYDSTAEYRYSETNSVIYSDDINEEWNENQIKPHIEYTYRIFSYEDGNFTEKLSVKASDYRYEWQFRRGLYAGNYMYIFSDKECVSINLSDFTETDRMIFK